MLIDSKTDPLDQIEKAESLEALRVGFDVPTDPTLP